VVCGVLQWLLGLVPLVSAAEQSFPIARPNEWNEGPFLVVATVDGSLYAIDQHTGNTIWEYKSGEALIKFGG